MKKTAVIILDIKEKGLLRDIEVPLDITVYDLVTGLNTAYQLGIDVEDVRNCYLRMDNPIALLRGDKILRDYGMHNCSVIHIGNG